MLVHQRVISTHVADFSFQNINRYNRCCEVSTKAFFQVHPITKWEGGNRSAAAQSRRLIYYEQALGFHGRSGTLVVVVFEALPIFLSTWTIYLDYINHTKPKKRMLETFPEWQPERCCLALVDGC